jgi:hypothetical protein
MKIDNNTNTFSIKAKNINDQLLLVTYDTKIFKIQYAIYKNYIIQVKYIDTLNDDTNVYKRINAILSKNTNCSNFLQNIFVNCRKYGMKINEMSFKEYVDNKLYFS